MTSKLTNIKTVKKEKPLQLRRFQSFSNLEKKYCSCLMKVRGRDYKLYKRNFKLPVNPHGICTNTLYNRRGLKRTKLVKCSKLYMFSKYLKKYLVAYAVEKDIPVYNENGKVLKKKELVNKIENVLKNEYKRTRLRKHMKHYTIFNKYLKKDLVAYAIEKDIPVYNENGKVLKKQELVNKIENVLKNEKMTRLKKRMEHYKQQEGGKFNFLKLFELLDKEYYNIMEIFNHKNLTLKELTRIRKNAKQMHYKIIKYHVYTKTKKGDMKVKIVTEKIR